MLDINWSSSVTKDATLLADAIELALAFGGDEYYGVFTQADFQHYVGIENLDDNDHSFLSGQAADERVTVFEQALQLIEQRSRWLGTVYPYSAGTDEVQFTPHTELNRNLPYLFMLVCSNDEYMSDIDSILADDFEHLCKEAFRALFPNWAQVLLFSRNTDDRIQEFGFKASVAVPKLAAKLNARPKNEDSLPDTGREFGIDLLAVCSFGDINTYSYFAFAQCTIQREWWTKRHEAKASSGLNGFVDLNVSHTNFVMIPFIPRKSDGRWDLLPDRTGDCIICDRVRICYMLNKTDFFERDHLPVEISDIFEKLQNQLSIDVCD